MSQLPKILQEVFHDQQVFTRSGRTALHSNVSEQECLRLYNMVREIKPTVSVEVGFAQGISTVAILQALDDNEQGCHHVLDPFQSRFENCGLVMVERANLSKRFVFHEKFAEEVIPSLPKLQFAFIDASHLFDLTLCEFVLIDKRLEVGGVIGLHDLWMPSLQTLVRFILKNRAYVVVEEEAEAKSPAASHGSLVARTARAVAKRLPGSNRLFSREFLKPWQEFHLPNMVLLRKTAEDTRDWREHNPF